MMQPTMSPLAPKLLAYVGNSGSTIPKPTRSMKTVRKMIASGERRDGDGLDMRQDDVAAGMEHPQGPRWLLPWSRHQVATEPAAKTFSTSAA